MQGIGRQRATCVLDLSFSICSWASRCPAFQYRGSELSKGEPSVVKVKQLYKSEFQLKGHQKPQTRGLGVLFLPTPKRMGLNSLSYSPDTGTKFPHSPVSRLWPWSVQRKRER